MEREASSVAKPVGTTKAILIYGPYPDRRDPTKWMIRIVDSDSGIDKKVIFYGSDTHPAHVTVRRCLTKRILARA
jgi:hypothetical protein